ncbi:MAG: YibE/F family protein [bacterium]
MKDWKLKLPALAIIIILCLIVNTRLYNYSSERKADDGSKVIVCVGRVISIDAGIAIGEPPSWTYPIDGQIITLRLLSGKFKGKEVFATNPLTGEYSDRVLKVGDKLYVNLRLRGDNSSIVSSANLGEYVRTPFLLYLACIFLALMIIIGGMKGIKAIFALVLSGVFIISILIPMCLKGYNPILIAIIVSAINTSLTFMLVGGITLKSLAGALGSIGGLLCVSLLASLANVMLHFTGLDVNFGFLTLGKLLWMTKESSGWNFSGLLTAGIIIGASGAIMDASMAVASAIEEVKKANPAIGMWRCMRAGLNVGKDEMGMMANTLIFAYIGADMTLILMPMIQFGEAGRAMPMMRLINEEATSAEIVQAIAGTIGLIMSIPITAFIAGFLMGGKSHTIEDQNFIFDKKYKAKKLIVPIALFVIVIGVHITYLESHQIFASQVDKKETVSEYVKAKILEKSDPIEIPGSNALGKGLVKNEILKVKILGGTFKGKQALVQNVNDPNRPDLYNVTTKIGDEIVMKINGSVDGIEQTILVNYNRDGYLIYLVGLFIIIMTIVGRHQGIRTAIALAISIVIVIKIMIPLIAEGYNAVFVVIVSSGLIALLSMIIVIGLNRKAGSATIGILGGVIVASAIVIYADQKLHFTGISSSRTAIVTQFTGSENLDFRKILMAGIIMGLLGTAMDAAMGVASSIREVKRANPNLSVIRLISSGMNVGTDLIGTMSNTLIFAYVGLRILLLLTFWGTNIFSGSKMEILSTETISAEILRLLAGSIGLVLTIPITAFTAAFWDKIVRFLGFNIR